MDEAAAPPQPEGLPHRDDYPALRLARRALLGAVLLFALTYYNLDLLPMMRYTMPPFLGLVAIGAVVGVAAPRKLVVATFAVWWVVVLAVVMRRSALSTGPLGTEIFHGALAKYPAGGVWVAEFLRLGVYLWALWLGGKGGRRLRQGRGT